MFCRGHGDDSSRTRRIRVNPHCLICSNILKFICSNIHICSIIVNISETPMSTAPGTLIQGASTVVDSILFRDAFGTPGMREIFSDRALIGRYIEVEVALARAEARCGVIPAEAAEVIARESRLERIDFDHMRAGDRHRRLPDPAAGAPAGRRCAARPAATSTGVRPRRTSWTRPTCCRCAPRSTSSTPTSASCAASWPIWRRSTATRRWPGARTCSRRCR